MSVKLKIDNSVSYVQGLNVEQFSRLRELMSYRLAPEAAFYGNKFRSPKRYLLNKRGEFPTGLLYVAKKFLSEEKVSFTVNDIRRLPEARPSDFPGVIGVTPYPEQEAVVKACKAAHRGIIVMPTGVGKSIVAALIVRAIGVKTLLVVPNLELKRQLTHTLGEIFGKQKVGGFGKPIAVENVDALDPEIEAKGYDCVIIDEFHHSGAATYRQLNKKSWKNIYYRFGLTATPFRSQENERLLLESVLSKVIYRLEYAQAVEKGYIVPVEAYYVDLPKKKEVEGYTWAQVYKELVVENEIRNSRIADLLLKLENSSIPTLCLVKEIQHGETLQAFTNIPFANGQDGEARSLIQDFNSRASNSLIGTSGILGEGVDTKPAEFVVIAGLGKSKNAFMQQVGRGLRRYPKKTSCKVILFRDSSHKFTLRHFQAQLKYLREEYGVEAVKLDL